MAPTTLLAYTHFAATRMRAGKNLVFRVIMKCWSSISTGNFKALNDVSLGDIYIYIYKVKSKKRESIVSFESIYTVGARKNFHQLKYYLLR